MTFKPTGSGPKPKAKAKPSTTTPPQPSPSTTTEPQPSSVSGSADADFSPAVEVEAGDGSHIQSLRFGAEEIDGAAVVSLDGAPPPATIDPEDFHKLFCGVFRTASELTGLRSLDVTQTPDRAAAASRAWYDTCEDLPWLRWMIQPGNKWIVRGVAVGSLFAPMAVGVAAELRERQKAKEPPQGTGDPLAPSHAPSDAPEPANDMDWVPDEKEQAA